MVNQKKGLDRRLTALDEVLDGGQKSIDELLRHFTYTLSAFDAEVRVPPPLTATMADDVVSSSRLLKIIARHQPDLVGGSLRRDEQEWIRDSRPGSSRDLRKDSFVEDVGIVLRGAASKPYGIGLYTSTARGNAGSMWRTFLELGSEDTLHPRPWSIWRLEVDSSASVCEITSAKAWCELLARYPLVHGGLVYPDWPKIYNHWDAVHISLAAIAASQGFALSVGSEASAPVYWDVECTFWLRWRFRSTELIDVVA
jgi:hypothetical protein